MERNKWETAIRCLEVALHPHTSDDEVVAGVNGFRRTAAGTPLREICLEFAGRDDGVATRWREKAERLARENLGLRRKLEAAERDRGATLRRLREAEQRSGELDEALRAAQRRADEAEQRFADFRAAHADMADSAPRAEMARPSAAERPVRTPPPPFRTFLAAARQRENQPETVMPPPIFNATPRAPWTA